ncbi:nuclear transport factor 2 family protein [Sorangium cellulosum]|uniref:nuclear transport factor 2 family protein n=1 Tax=Sorangium cellulosum TaxID=56 RepID=UPI003D9A44CF
MRSMVEAAVKTYIDAASERDPEKRAAMLEACFAADGRVVSRSREIRGRAAVADEIAKLLADPLLVRVRVLSVLETGNTTFRFRSVVERGDGKNIEFFDAGEVDATGHISLVLTFAGPLREAADA